MAISEETLIAYVDGELGAAERDALEAALAGDEALRARVAAHRTLRARLSIAFDGALEEPVPERLRHAAAPGAQIVNLAERRTRAWSARDWGAMAASVAAGLVLGIGIMGRPAPMIAAESGGLTARGALARALDNQLASDEAHAVRIGLSFRTQDGGYCRTFDLIDAETSGLACRTDGSWSVAVAAAHPTTAEVRMAGAAAEVIAGVEARIAGDPLDAEAEARARDAGWR